LKGPEQAHPQKREAHEGRCNSQQRPQKHWDSHGKCTTNQVKVLCVFEVPGEGTPSAKAPKAKEDLYCSQIKDSLEQVEDAAKGGHEISYEGDNGPLVYQGHFFGEG